MSKEVTMRDIARELNISAVSVSKAISGKEGVSESVRMKILKKAEEMGYEYTSPGNSSEKHFSFGVVVAQAYISDSAFYAKLFQNLSMEFAKKQHLCTLEIISREDEEAGILPGNIIAKRIDGLIVMGPISKACIDKILKIEMPCVFVDNYAPEFNFDCVVSDNVYGSYMLTDYVIGKGHKKIAFVGNIFATNSIMDRYLGYVKGMLQNNCPLISDYLISDRDDAGNLIEMTIPVNLPDAFVCNCDETAYHLINTLMKANIRVPEDVSVVGFDDYIFATISSPQLTTYKVDMEKMSRFAVDLMIRKMYASEDTVTGKKIVSGEITIRDSVKERR